MQSAPSTDRGGATDLCRSGVRGATRKGALPGKPPAIRPRPSGALTSGSAFAAGVAANLVQTIFDGGRIAAKIDLRNAIQEPAYAAGSVARCGRGAPCLP